MFRKLISISALSVAALSFVSCGSEQSTTQRTSPNKQYVNEADLEGVFGDNTSSESVEVKDSQLEAASLQLTTGVNEAFANAGLEVGGGQVDNIVTLILSVFTAITTGDMGSVMGILNELIAMVVGLIGGGDESFALQDSTNDTISDVINVLLGSLSALISGDIDAFVTVMIEFISNLVGGLA